MFWSEGRKQELRDKKKAQELYLQVKSEVEKCVAYLKEKRESDPYRNILSRLIHQAAHGLTSQIPTFELWFTPWRELHLAFVDLYLSWIPVAN